MPDLLHSLANVDKGFLEIVAERWGIDLQAADAHSGSLQLSSALLDERLFREVFSALPGEAQAALNSLRMKNGKLPWLNFIRRFGAVREMGIARRDRERPYLNPISVAEILWYHALVFRAFLKTDSGPQEFAYVPDEFLAWIPTSIATPPNPPGNPALPEEFQVIQPATDEILDQACTLLAALRVSTEDEIPQGSSPIPQPILMAFLTAAGLLDETHVPLSEPVRFFLESPRGEALTLLAHHWKASSSFDELRLLPGLICDGKWKNNPLKTRQNLLGMLSEIPADHWWSLDSFIQWTKEHQPDFQRSAGEYDSWLIRSQKEDTSLIGFEHWDEIEGALCRFFITGPLYWLGIVELATDAPGQKVLAFRFSTWAQALLDEAALPPDLENEDTPIQVLPSGRILFPALVPRSLRYQVGRFCNLEPLAGKEFSYSITPASLEKAAQQGLHINQLIGLLRKQAASPISPTLVQALERWETNHIQASLEQVSILRVSSPEILNALRRSPAGRFLGPPLNATTSIVQAGAAEKIKRAMVELGYLVDDRPLNAK